ncbi:MAG: Bug family tripartite tricarboxylate transporter substrate binding protein [bacterium]
MAWMRRVFCWLVACLAVISAFAALHAPPAGGQAAYYAGKAIEIIVPFAPGGAADVGARFVAPFMEKHIAGNPRVTVRNVPGGGSMLGASSFAANAKPDGLTLLCTTSSTVFPWMFGHPSAQYDLSKMRVAATLAFGPVVYSAPRTGVRRPADLLKPTERLTYGGIAATGSDLPILIAFELLKLDIKVVLGFEGRGPIRLAFERGETNFDFQFTPVYLTQVVPLVNERKAIAIMTGGAPNERGELILRDPVVPQLPSVFDVYRELYNSRPAGPRWRAYEAAAALTFTYGLTWWAPEGTAPDALRAISEAVDRMNADRDFQQRAKSVTGGYPVVRGDTAERGVQKAMRPTLDVRKYIMDLLRDRYGVRL